MKYKVGDRIVIDNPEMYNDLRYLQDRDKFVTIGGVVDCDCNLAARCRICNKYCYQIIGGLHQIGGYSGYCEGILHANSRLYVIPAKPKLFKLHED